MASFWSHEEDVYLHEGCQAIGGATRHGHDVVFGFVISLVDTHHEHGSVFAEPRDDHLLGSAFKMHCGSLLLRVVSSALHHVICSVLTPRNLRKVPAKVQPNCKTPNFGDDYHRAHEG
jgi:hypothetical protein